jgi:hypothetical protein
VEPGDHCIEGIKIAQQWLHILEFRGIISKIDEWRRMHWRQPDSIHAKPRNMVYMFKDTAKVSPAIAVAVAKAERVDLVQDRTPPPWHRQRITHGPVLRPQPRDNGFGLNLD